MSTTATPLARTQDNHRTDDQHTGSRSGARHVFARLRRKPKAAEPPAIDWFAA